jgi:hypothetical protein
MVSAAPRFVDVAEEMHAFMDGHVWVGHNIRAYDNRIVAEAFQRLGQAGPINAGVIDTLTVTRSCFNNVAGNNKLAVLSEHFGLGIASHRALEDARLTLEVVKRMLTPRAILGAFKESPTATTTTHEQPATKECLWLKRDRLATGEEPALKLGRPVYARELHPGEKWVPERCELTGKAADAYQMFKDSVPLTTIEAKLKVKATTLSGYLMKGFANEPVGVNSSILTSWKLLEIDDAKELVCISELVPLQSKLDDLRKPIEAERDSLMQANEISWDILKFCRLKELINKSLRPGASTMALSLSGRDQFASKYDRRAGCGL